MLNTNTIFLCIIEPEKMSTKLSNRKRRMLCKLNHVVINTIVTVELSVPVLVFAAAASQQAELQSDGKFHWVYSVSSGGNTFEADLAGWVDIPNKQVVLEMRITCNTLQPQLNKFLWYIGRNEIDASSGCWLFYDHTQPTASVEVAHIDWEIAYQNDRTLTYSAINQICFWARNC